MANVDTLIQEGIAAIKAGRADDARRALMKAVELDEQSEQGWLWLSACVATPEEQQICLENVLAINPNNEKARKGLAVINQKKGVSAPLPPAPSPKQDIFGDINMGSSPFGDPSGWDSDPFASPSSVDWNKDNSSTSTPRSDQQLPTADELDSWVSGLSLSTPQPESPFGSSSPFGDTSSSFSDDPFGSSPDFDSVSDPFGSKAADPFGSPASPFSFDMPASSQNDDLGFDMAAPASSSTFDFGASSSAPANPFSSFDFDEVPSTPSDADPFGSGPFSAPGGLDDVADPFGSNPFAVEDDPFQDSGSAFSFSTPSQSPGIPKADPFAASSSAFSTSIQDDDLFDPGADDVFANVPGSKPATSPSGVKGKSSAFGSTSVFDENTRKKTPSGSFAFSGNRMTSAQQSYFKVIPPEIQASGGGSKPDIKLVATVAGLALLNMISVAMLMLNLMRR